MAYITARSNTHMIKSTYRFTLAALLCATLGCEDGHKDKGGGGATDQEVMMACKTYCDQAQVCKTKAQAGECLAKCQDRLGDCMADEQDQTLDDLRSCAAKACDKFTGCTIGAGLQCVLGL